MSVIAITYHDENIRGIVKSINKSVEKSLPRENFKQAKKRRNVEINQNVRPNYFSEVDPCNYLKSGSGRPSYSLNPSKAKHECLRKPKCFPTQQEIRNYESKATCTNFIRRNISKVVHSQCKEVEPYMVMDQYGNKKPLNRGLEPLFIRKTTFGKTPIYLEKFNQERHKLYQMQKDASGVEKPRCHYITRDERDELLQGLKYNWQELQHAYQGLPLLTDTIPKIVRKSKIEDQLKQLEKDIVLLERHPYIYIYNDNEEF